MSVFSVWFFLGLGMIYLARQCDKMRWRIEELEAWKEKVKDQLL